ncbi:YceI family protein [Actinobacteria bacterium OK074]|nr:YceI family protein [Actinobacteria bacterium OK074]
MSTAVEAGTWQLDATRSTVAFQARSVWGLVLVKGTFAGVAGGGEVGADGSANGSITLEAASLDTGHTKRDIHLRSADFFDVERHPEITFAVRSAKLEAGKTVKVVGQLTVRGISRPQTLTAELTESAADAVTLTVQFTADRTEFGMTWNQMGMMRGLTTVTASLRFVRSAA